MVSTSVSSSKKREEISKATGNSPEWRRQHFVSYNGNGIERRGNNYSEANKTGIV